jgi:hypothetical protein
MSKSNDETSAYYEAGHCVIARVLDIHVLLVTLSEGARSGTVGRTLTYNRLRHVAEENGDTPGSLLAIAAEAKIALAGPLAQLRRRPRTNRKRAKHTEWREDFKTAMACITALLRLRAKTVSKAEAIRIRQCLEAEPKVLIKENWATVERVAKALLKHRVVNVYQVDDLIAGRRLSRSSKRKADAGRGRHCAQQREE